MTQRLIQHQPIPRTTSLDEAERQRVYDLLRVQQNVQVIFDELADKQHFESFIIKGVALTTGENNFINHLLGRTINGWWIAKRNANATIWEDEDVSVNSSQQVVLKCSANVTIDLVVY